METQANQQPAYHILLLEDDVSLIDGLKYALHKNGFTVETVRTVNEALGRLFRSDSSQPVPSDKGIRLDDLFSQYSLLLLDVSLPDGTGFEVCEKVREWDKLLPIMFLTASDEEVNVIRGLDGGADDYITKPFKIGELCSRIRALLRRCAQSAQTPAKTPASSGGLTIDFASCRVTRNDSVIELTKAEYRLLSLLVRNAGRTVTRELILNELWDNAGDFVDDNTLSVYMRRLREKLEETPSSPKHLITVRGFGYRYEP